MDHPAGKFGLSVVGGGYCQIYWLDGELLVS